MSDPEIVEYYRRVHKTALARDAEDSLAPVIAPWDGPIANRFEDYAQRLAMRIALRHLRQRYSSLKGLRVLDIGCGRGRWARFYAANGALVTGTDVSEEALDAVRSEMPGHTFVCQDVRHLELGPDKFDVANSVTVLQHLTPEGQAQALARLARHLRPGGTLILLENTFDSGGPHMSVHQENEWVRMAASVDFMLVGSRQTCFNCSLRIARFLARPFTSASKLCAEGWSLDRSEGFTRRTIKEVLSLFSFPLELLLTAVPAVSGTHSLMLFELRAHKAPRVPTA
jgi:SAM-dependent methyltransferase